MTNRNMTNVMVQESQLAAPIMNKVILENDLSKLTDAERLQYAMAVCKHAGLDPVSQPLIYLTLKGKLSLYATKSATEQLTRIHKISLDVEFLPDRDGLLFARCTATRPNGDGTTQSVNAHSAITKPKGADDYAIAIAKLDTKVRRRATLAIVGFGLSDEGDAAPGSQVIDSSPVVVQQPPQIERQLDDGDDELSQGWGALFMEAARRKFSRDRVVARATAKFEKPASAITIDELHELISAFVDEAEPAQAASVTGNDEDPEDDGS